MSSTELPFTADDAGLDDRPATAGPGWAQRQRLGDQLRAVRRWIVFVGVAATAAFSFLAVRQTTTASAPPPAGTQSVGSRTTLPANAPSQSLFTGGTTSSGLGGSGFSLAPAPRSGGSFFRSSSS